MQCNGQITSGLVAIILPTVIIMNIANGEIYLNRTIKPDVLLEALTGVSELPLSPA
jgi:hypothetical protein